MAAAQRPGGQQGKICQFKLVLLGKPRCCAVQCRVAAAIERVKITDCDVTYYRRIGRRQVFARPSLCERSISRIPGGEEAAATWLLKLYVLITTLRFSLQLVRRS